MLLPQVGHSTQSPSPLRNLQTVWEPWQVASNLTIDRDFSPGHTLFSTFSAVCWLFGRHISTSLSETGDVPVGLVSNNWGGTKVRKISPLFFLLPHSPFRLLFFFSLFLFFFCCCCCCCC